MYNVPWAVIQVTPLPDYKIQVTFNDGVVGIEDLKPHIFGREGTMFTPLRDPAVFNRPYIVHGAVTWESGLDLAPDAMWERITGRYGEAISIAR